MSRIAVVCGMLVLGVALALGQAGPKAPAPTVPAVAAPEVPAKAEAPALTALRSVFPEFLELPADPQTKLGSVLKGLTGRVEKDFKLKVQFSINNDAFNKDNIKEPLEIGIVEDKPLPAMRNITLERYLRAIFDRVDEKGPKAENSGATFLIRKHHIEITTIKDLRTRIWGDYPGPFLPLVNATFEKKTLEDALKELSEQTEHNVVLDARAGDKAKTLVTACFSNLPLDTAVAFLADMAELQPVLQDNAIYVTTRESALRWESRQKKNMPEDSETPRIGRVGAGVRGFVPSPAQGGGM